jgi:hypothetical protein
MIKQISLIAIAIGVAGLVFQATNAQAATLKAAPPQPILTAGHDQILRSSTGIILKAGSDSINIPLQQRAMLAEREAAK